MARAARSSTASTVYSAGTQSSRSKPGLGSIVKYIQVTNCLLSFVLFLSSFERLEWLADRPLVDLHLYIPYSAPKLSILVDTHSQILVYIGLLLHVLSMKLSTVCLTNKKKTFNCLCLEEDHHIWTSQLRLVAFGLCPQFNPRVERGSTDLQNDLQLSRLRTLGIQPSCSTTTKRKKETSSVYFPSVISNQPFHVNQTQKSISRGCKQLWSIDQQWWRHEYF